MGKTLPGIWIIRSYAPLVGYVLIFFASFNVSFVFGWKTWMGRASDGEDFTGNLHYTLICFFGWLRLNYLHSLMSILLEQTWMGRASDGEDFTGNLYYTLICSFGRLHLDFFVTLLSSC